MQVEEYLRISYSPDEEYRDGVLVHRDMGTRSHSKLQAWLLFYLGNHEEQWKTETYASLRVRARQNWYAVPDVCVYELPAPEEEIPSRMPLLWIEILSPDDTMAAVLEKARQVVECGSPYVWIIDPDTLESYLQTTAGLASVPEKTLRLPDGSIVIPLVEVMKKK